MYGIPSFTYHLQPLMEKTISLRREFEADGASTCESKFSCVPVETIRFCKIFKHRLTQLEHVGAWLFFSSADSYVA